MLRIFLCSVLTALSLQGPQSTFWVDSVEVESEFNSSYIFNYANRIVPPDKEVESTDIECLRKELLSTGLFEQLNLRLVETKTPRVYRLVISPVYSHQGGVYTISGVSLEGFPEVDESKFQAALAKGNVLAKSLSFKKPFAEFEDELGEILRSVYPKTSINPFLGKPWIRIKPASPHQVKITLSPAFDGCKRGRLPGKTNCVQRSPLFHQ